MFSAFMAFVVTAFLAVSPVSTQSSFPTWDDYARDPRGRLIITDDGPLTNADLDVSDVHCDH